MSARESAPRSSRRRRGFGPSLPVAWQERAQCRGPQSAYFFPPVIPESPEDRYEREVFAKSFCKSCSVCSDCLQYATMRGEDFGIWGGLNEGERRLLKLKSS